MAKPVQKKSEGHSKEKAIEALNGLSGKSLGMKVAKVSAFTAGMSKFNQSYMEIPVSKLKAPKNATLRKEYVRDAIENGIVRTDFIAGEKYSARVAKHDKEYIVTENAENIVAARLLGIKKVRIRLDQ